MATVPVGVILIWPGTNASIPAGWARETALDGKFPKATANLINPNVTGGSDTHTHTSPAHTHAAQAHRHFGQTMQQTSAIGEDTGNSGSNDASHDDHYHNFDFTNITAGNLVDAVSCAAGSSLPPHREVIFIKPDGSPADPPAGVIALFSSVTLPTNWNVCDGLNSTPDLTDKYLRGAAAGVDGGGLGGSLNHSHPVNHTHTAVAHSHVGLSQNDSNADRFRDSSGSGGSVVPRHAHGVGLSDVSEAGSSYVGNAGIADLVEPLFRKLLAIQNNTGGGDRPRFIIGLWIGTLGTIPAGWSLCDGNNGTIDMRSYHLKVTPNTAQIAQTGGANTHIHAPSNSHTHTASGAHTHTGSTDTYVATGSTGSGSALGAKTHSHTSLNSCSSNTTTWDPATVQADSSNGEPAFLTVAFIQFSGVPASDQRTAQTTGQISTNNQRPAQVTGVVPSEQRNAEVTGQVAENEERAAEIKGMIQWVRDPKPALNIYSA